mmetsp:Transcript_13600/g.33292  ORF Transcript_13600/g.33292 Transcript_13600/m.33292 type:complete len:164 (+) Transcript_13600:81-572(+)
MMSFEALPPPRYPLGYSTILKHRPRAGEEKQSEMDCDTSTAFERHMEYEKSWKTKMARILLKASNRIRRCSAKCINQINDMPTFRKPEIVIWYMFAILLLGLCFMPGSKTPGTLQRSVDRIPKTDVQLTIPHKNEISEVDNGGQKKDIPDDLCNQNLTSPARL